MQALQQILRQVVVRQTIKAPPHTSIIKCTTTNHNLPPFSKCPRRCYHPIYAARRQKQPVSSITSTFPTHRPSFSTTVLASSSPSSPPSHATEPYPLSLNEFHRLSDAYIDSLVTELEEIQSEREEVDVEYSAGVLTLILPPAGTYVLNKQPPNKQIWLSSPISGPKRYDWVKPVSTGEGGMWTYLRDGSTLNTLLMEEIGVNMEDK